MVALIAVFWAVPERTPVPVASGAVRAPWVQHHSDSGGYRFSAPARWSAREAGSVSTVRSPGRDVVVSFGRAPDGSLAEASDALVDSIRDRYGIVRVVGIDRSSIGGLPGAVVAGSTRNRAGVAVRFAAVAVQGTEANFAIIVFTAEDAEPGLRRITERILASFRVI